MPNKHVHESTQFIFQPHRSVCTDAAVRPTLRRPPPAPHIIQKGPQISLCRLQTTSRASMGQDRLSALAMQHMSGTTCTKLTYLKLYKFSQKHSRRMLPRQCAAPLTLIYWDYPSTRPNGQFHLSYTVWERILMDCRQCRMN